MGARHNRQLGPLTATSADSGPFLLRADAVAERWIYRLLERTQTALRSAATALTPLALAAWAASRGGSSKWCLAAGEYPGE